MQQNPQQHGKMTMTAATVTTDSQVGGTTDSQAGSKDSMSLLKREAIEQNQACQEETLRQIINLQVVDAVTSKPALDQL